VVSATFFTLVAQKGAQHMCRHARQLIVGIQAAKPCGEEDLPQTSTIVKV
jgi:hypothetical protein